MHRKEIRDICKYLKNEKSFQPVDIPAVSESVRMLLTNRGLISLREKKRNNKIR